MAKNTSSKSKSNSWANGRKKLPFHSPKPTKADKAKISEAVRDGSVQIAHLDQLVGESDWLKIQFDSDNGVWLIMHTFTSDGSDEPTGIVSYRAKTLHKGVALALFFRDEISDSDFIQEDDDDF